ncbi:hypothetical protein ACERII_05650 [Evansella sp. AB-rgal1]|uniref:hypothetical protein n=1 Tax=Evansella sp. AB-rgal1 TaxID=3242696 RepID=UPI00359E5319
MVVKNNLKSFAIHVFIVSLSLPVLFLGQNLDNNRLYYGIWFLLVFTLYFILGRKFLVKSNQNQNIKGTSCVAIIGVLLTAIVSIFPGKMGWNWLYFNFLYFPYALPFIEWIPLGQQGKELHSFFLYFIISLIPSVMMYVGLVTKKSR